MKIEFLIITLLAISISTTYSFAQTPINCHFGNESTSLDDIFENDLAVKEFAKKHPDATRYVAMEDIKPPNGELSFTAENSEEKEVLLIEFTQNENGCYRPKHYVYSYDNGTIDATVRNSLSNFTEIMDLIKLDDKKIEDFYSKNCNSISLDYVIDGTKPYFCKSDRDNAIQMLLQKFEGGSIEVHITDEVMDALFYNCNLNGDFFVLNNGEEIHYDLVAENNTKVFKMELPVGYSKVEIIGFSYLSGVDTFCGSIWGDDSRYISPHLQANIGVEPWMVQCNDGLIRIFKPLDFQTPACVFPDSISKLNERGWQTNKNE